MSFCVRPLWQHLILEILELCRFAFLHWYHLSFERCELCRFGFLHSQHLLTTSDFRILRIMSCCVPPFWQHLIFVIWEICRFAFLHLQHLTFSRFAKYVVLLSSIDSMWLVKSGHRLFGHPSSSSVLTSCFWTRAFVHLLDSDGRCADHGRCGGPHEVFLRQPLSKQVQLSSASKQNSWY